eukprot:TRINITY_DN62888_c0_g1_i1.p1 TRINITY_DN62888_c0_g1~~TRINITY_DN62888_c0_g1_i1.p1  ORF type:complete len:918 (-),score=123.69 TRINITY_DN62888_c0_g1_i1:1288-4041(-)
MADLSVGAEEGDAVQVAVRMRVFNQREKTACADRIVRMEVLDKGSKTFIKDPDTGEERDFKYDYSFQSHSETEQGIGAYATQETVMQTLGIPVLNAALEGRNISLFAYGQTGAGKSFSMLGKVGVPELEGIIPRSCREIFRRIDNETNPLITQTVDIQVVEIYCEQINDLLADRKVWPAQGHKARLTAKFGYVVDTITKPCFNFDDINSAMEFADKNRSVGSHALNPESSRAHTIYQINYAKITKNENGKVVETVTAKLNLIDLAGSERTDSAGTSGQMLKEGNAINLSLTALGGCIKALSENKKPNFRDSKLTLLLQASMTNGKVIMIAALSPASICYAETLSTLKFADRIKQVKIKCGKNVSADPVAELKKAMEAMRLQMQQEIDRLREGGASLEGAEKTAQMKEMEVRMKEQKEAEAAMRADLQKKLTELQEGSEGRRARANGINQNWSKAFQGLSAAGADEKAPHFVNLNEDPRLAETLVYPFPQGQTTTIGRSNPGNPPVLEFNGMGMIKDHCGVEHTEDGEVFLIPQNDSRTFLNGKKISEKTKLVHQMRVWLGNNYAFRFNFPGKEDEGEGKEENPDYIFASEEMAEANSAAILASSGSAQSDLPPELNVKLAESLQKVQQATMIVSDLNKDITFAPKIYKNRFTGEDDVAVYVRIGVNELLWRWDKFTTRLIEMSNAWQGWQQSGELPKFEPDQDPFDDTEHQLIGEADVWLQSLANMIELQADTGILTPFGHVEGKINVEINPCDKNGDPGPWDDDSELDPFVDKPEELLDTDIQFVVKVNHMVLEVNLAHGSGCKYEKTFVRYKFNMGDEEEEWHSTVQDESGTFTPKYHFEKKHKVHVDQHILKHITLGRIVFQVWGKLAKNIRPPVRPDPSTKRNELEAIQKEIDRKKKLLLCPHCDKDLVQVSE